MAHFRAGCKGSRQTVTRLAGKRGATAFVNGWESGARIVSGNDDAGDFFEVWATCGSNGAGSSVFLGTIRKTDKQLVFVPAKK